jgi:hypothetical protein
MSIEAALAYLESQASALAQNAGSPKARWHILSNAIATNLAMYRQAQARGYGVKYAEQRIIESADAWQVSMDNEVKLMRGW